MNPLDTQILAALHRSPSGIRRLTKVTRRSTRHVRESIDRLQALGLVHVADIGPQGGHFYAATLTPRT